MQNLQEKDILIFGANAGNKGTTAYGTAKTTTPTFTNDPAIIQNANWQAGIEGALDSNGFYYAEDQNGVPLALSYGIANIQQKGISNYSPTRTYFVGGICCVIENNRPTLFYSLTDNNINNNPITSQTNWFNLNQLNFTSLTIVNSINFNEFNKNGNFTIANNIHTNAPITTQFTCNLQVFNDGTINNVVQLLQDITNENSYIRYCINGIWNEWINTSVNDKANKDLSNISSNIDFIVERGGTTNLWYRKWKSGFIEQGGFTSSHNPTTYNFLIPFTNKNYSFLGGSVESTGMNFNAVTVKISNSSKTISSCEIACAIGGGYGGSGYWQVSGY